MRRAAAIAALLAGAALAAGPPVARGQIFAVETVGGPAAVHQLPVSVSGAVAVEFHGDRAAGCEQAHLCDVAGEETFAPGRSAALAVFGRSRPAGGLLFFDAGASDQGARTIARVRRTAPDGSVHTCSDVAADRGGGELQVAGGQLVVSVLGAAPGGIGQSGLLGTRCAGPLDSDVAALLPVGRLTAQQLATGRTSVDLTGTRSFAAHGLAGTIRSSVVLGIGAPQHETGRAPRFARSKRYRIVTVDFSIERVTGRVGLSFRGVPQPELCQALDACDLAGTIDTSLDAAGGRLELVGFGSGRLSRRQLLERVGVLRAPHGPRPLAFGTGFWPGGGTVTAALTRAGTPACADREGIPGGVLELLARGPRLTMGYLPGFDSGRDALPLHCPGPADSDLGQDTPLAGATVASSVLRRRRFGVRMRRGASFTAPGYGGSSTADVTVVLRRRRIGFQSFRAPVPSGGGGVGFTISDEIVRSRHGRTLAR